MINHKKIMHSFLKLGGMSKLFLLYESISEITFENFQSGIDDLILIELEENDLLYKNSSLNNLENYYELYQRPSQDNQFRAEFLEKINFYEVDPKSIAELVEVFPNKVSGFFGINFPQFDIKIDYCVQNNDKFKEFKNFYLSLIDCSNFSDFKKDYFPNIIFCDKAEYQLKSYGNSKIFFQCLEQFIILEKYLKTWTDGNFSYKELKTSTTIDLSLESATTMGKFSNERVFSLPNGGTAVFELHMKLGEIRIHVLEDNVTKKIMIGYIGKHLTT